MPEIIDLIVTVSSQNKIKKVTLSFQRKPASV
jgi:hypothetical protein